MTPSKEPPYILYCDGASRGNPGPGSFGYVILHGERTVAEEGGTLGTVTNNVAEYHALLHGLRHCQRLKAHVVVVRSDSELLVRQMTGKYRVKAPQILPLFQEARILGQGFRRIYFEHVPREKNARADALANAALDGTL